MEFNSCFEALQSKYSIGNGPVFVALFKRDFTTMYYELISTINQKYNSRTIIKMHFNDFIRQFLFLFM